MAECEIKREARIYKKLRRWKIEARLFIAFSQSPAIYRGKFIKLFIEV
jgi:hypothetical protein